MRIFSSCTRFIISSFFVSIFFLLFSVGAVHASGGTVVAWGANEWGQSDVPAGLTDVKAIASGDAFSLALKSDGTVVAWGINAADAYAPYYNQPYYGQTDVPAGLTDVKAIAAGWGHSLALKSDGTVVAWGTNVEGETNVPAGLTDVKAVAAGRYQSLALKSDGTVIAWGYGSSAIPPVGLTDVVAIAAQGENSLALKSDGTVVAWGNNANHQNDIPAGLTDVKAIAVGWFHSFALKQDGTLVSWGNASNGEADFPSGLTNVKAISAGTSFSLALKSDGTVVGWGYDGYGGTNIPTGLTGVTAISSSWETGLALVGGADTTAPTLNLPSTITTNATSADGAVVSYTVTATDPDNESSDLTVSCSPVSGSVFPIGTTTVNCSASDPAGNTANGSFHVVVVVNAPTDKDQCKKGGWQHLTDGLGNPFPNQGQCVSYVNHH